MKANEAKKAGLVWLQVTMSGGKDTPILGACTVSSRGPLDPKAAFLAWLLMRGVPIKDAQRELRSAWKDHLDKAASKKAKARALRG